MDKVLVREVAQVASDLTTKSVFSLGSDLPAVGDALKRLVSVLTSIDARVTALEAARVTPAQAAGVAPLGVAGLNTGSKVPAGAQA